MQQQLEIEYFWPLTEQINLDLDFSACTSPHYYVRSDYVIGLDCTGTAINMAPTWTSSLHIDSETITFNNLAMPWYRKALFKLLGFKWGK